VAGSIYATSVDLDKSIRNTRVFGSEAELPSVTW
jgi:hypothetical protein